MASREETSQGLQVVLGSEAHEGPGFNLGTSELQVEASRLSICGV